MTRMINFFELLDDHQQVDRQVFIKVYRVGAYRGEEGPFYLLISRDRHGYRHEMAMSYTERAALIGVLHETTRILRQDW